jgi:hypothetical protein
VNTYELVAELIEAGQLRVRGALASAGWQFSQPVPSVAQIESTSASSVIATADSIHLAANCYLAQGNWSRINTAIPGMLFIVRQTGVVEMYYAAAGANPIAWTKSSMRVGNAADTSTAWVPFSYVNGWSAYADGNFGANAGWRKMPDGLIVTRGLVTAGTQGVMAVLPAGARPINTMLFAAAMNGGVVRLDLDNVGNLGCSSGTLAGGAWNNAWISLNGISYLAEA